MKEILLDCLYLGILIAINIACSTYYNIKVQDIKFDINKMLEGVYKSAIIVFSFVGLTYVFSKVPYVAESIGLALGIDGLSSMVIMNGALVMYGGYAVKSLYDALKVKVIKKV